MFEEYEIGCKVWVKVPKLNEKKEGEHVQVQCNNP